MTDFDERIPIYLQIMDLIKKKIIKGELKGGDKLPSVRELALELKVNPNTVQRVYQELEREGIIETVKGVGSFVISNEKKLMKLKENLASERIKAFIKEMKEINLSKEDLNLLLAKYWEEVN
uniref:GntR family transcriptional regulator n=1 Tax=Dictyoglomus thermophilum TaxID=14 RepID=A0A7C3RJH8_DICTH